MTARASDVRFSFDVAGRSTTALVYAAPSSPRRARRTLVLAHGAGASQTHPWMIGMATAIAARGIEVVSFNFLYAERRSSARRQGAPDKSDVLEATWLAALAAVRGRGAPTRLFIGGKSMGGRIATHIAARPDVDVEGLVLLGYPLHPPGQPQKLRTAHWPRVRAPMLLVQGSRDAFGTPEELAPFLQGRAAGTRIFVVEGGDHSFAVPRTRGDLATTLARVADEVAAFMK